MPTAAQVEKWASGGEPDNETEARAREQWVLSQKASPRITKHETQAQPDTRFIMADINDPQIALIQEREPASLLEDDMAHPKWDVVAWLRRDLWEQMGCPVSLVVSFRAGTLAESGHPSGQ